MRRHFSAPERHIAPWLALVGLVLLVQWVMAPFWRAIAWAGIVAYTTWPFMLWLRTRLSGHDNWAALLGTSLVATIFLAPVLSFVWLAQQEMAALIAHLRHWLAEPPPVALALHALPWLGDWLEQQRALWLTDPDGVTAQLKSWLAAHAATAAQVAGDIGRYLAEMLLMLVILFFCYRDGEAMLHQLRAVLARFIGRRVHGYLAAAAAMTRAVVYGILLTAVVQGVVAGLGYWFTDLPSPVMLTIATILFALIPFMAPLVWASAGAWLAFQGQLGMAIGLWIWGLAVVSQIDNVIRPFFISRVGAIPLLLVLFGVFGGVLAFGLLGLFVGPIILAVAWAVWCEWSEQLAASGVSGQD